MSITTVSKYSDENIVFNHCRNDSPLSTDSAYTFHTHDICEIIFLVDGDVSGVIGAKTYKLHKNNLIIFRSPTIHRIRIDSDVPYERYNILFDEKLTANGVFEKIPEALSVIDYSENHYVADLFAKLDFYSLHFGGEDIKKLICALVDEIIFNLTLASQNTSPAVYTSSNSLVNRALEYIDENYLYPISVEDVSSHLYISKRHLHYLFLEHFQLSPKKYINSKRLAQAQKLIRMGIKPYNLYHTCGFGDYATFYRNFKSHFGYPPSGEIARKPKREIKS